jgi:hypothetical protein
MIFNLATLVIAFMASTASAQLDLYAEVNFYSDGGCIGTTQTNPIYTTQFCAQDCQQVPQGSNFFQVSSNNTDEFTTCYFWQDSYCGGQSGDSPPDADNYYASLNSEQLCPSLPDSDGESLSMRCYTGLCPSS